MIDLYYFDLLGVFAFAVFGAFVAMKKKFDLFGIFVCALLNGLGGGTIREIILGQIPGYFVNYTYIYVVCIGTFCALLLYKNFHLFQKYFLIIDAIGLVTFAYLGAARAAEFHLTGLGIVMFATISAVGGGILRDLCLGEKPTIFYRDFYASIAVLSGLFYAVFRENISIPLHAYALMFSMFLLRVLAIQHNWRLWKLP